MATEQGTNTAPRKKSAAIWYILGGVTFGILFLCCAGGGGFYLYWDYSAKKTVIEWQNQVESEPGIEVSASHLATLDSNLADRAYKGKVVVVVGAIHTIDGKTVNLVGFIFTDVSCEFSEAHKGQVANLKEGMAVKIKGVCTGKHFLTNGVTVKECKLLE